MTDESILLVDDDGDIIFHFENILKKEGYSVVSASYGKEALLKIKDNKFDVAIIDIMLPDMRGDQLAKDLRKKEPSLKLIFITGFSYMDECIKALDIGISEILLKPISQDELLNTVKNVFE